MSDKISGMNKQLLPSGTIHKLPADLRKALAGDDAALVAWNDITPLARNEWICWVENAKQIETRNRRIERTHKELAEGKRRPCCWLGCIHRADKPVSPSVQWVLDKKKSK